MYRKTKMPGTSFKVNKSYLAETLEQAIRKAVKQGEPITEGAPAIFPPDPNTSNPAHDIRADKWEIAQNSLGEVAKAKAAKGDGSLKTDEPGPGPKGE